LSKESLWLSIVEDIKSCKLCRLSSYRTNAVPGEGPLNASIVFVGEAPGKSEDLAGRPFVGAAGKLLTELLESNGIKREEVFITNVVKCRPPDNRDPFEDEISACSIHTNKIVELIRPSMIVTLGNHSGRYFFEVLGGIKWYGVKRARGKVYKLRILGNDVVLIPTYHPAAALYNPKVREELEEDFKLIVKTYDELSKPKPTQEKRKTLLDFMK